MNKKLLTMAFVLLCATLATSCKGPKDLESPDYSQQASNTIVFACESAWGGENQIFWSADNRLGVFCEQTDTKNLELGAASISTGELVGLFYSKLLWPQEGACHFFLYAPYIDGDQTTTISGSLSDTQTQRGATTTHIQENCLMYADITSETIKTPIATQLNHVFGYVDFVASSEVEYTDWRIKSITLTNQSDIPFSGDYTFDMTTGKLSFAQGGSSLMLKIADASTLNTPFHGYAITNPAAIGGIECDVQVILQKEEEEDLVLTAKITPTNNIAPEVITTISLNLDEMETGMVEDTSIDLSDPSNTGQKITANCYVAGISGQTYRFPATTMGNGYTTLATADYTGAGIADGITPTELAPQSAQLLWQTSKGLISDVKLKSGYIYFTLNGSESVALAEGNASIAIFDQKNGEGNILWSWHIWVTAADLNSSVQTYAIHSNYTAAGVTTMMDRNLGALDNKYYKVNNNNQSLGLLYQWGRKDPFISMDDADVGVQNAFLPLNRVRKSYDASDKELGLPGTVLNAKSWAYAPGLSITPENIARYPMNAAWDDKDNWLGESRDDLWGNPFSADISQTGHKSIYDPCPPGYRVCHRYTGTMFTTTGLNTKVFTDMNAVNLTATVSTNGGQIFRYNGSSTTYYPACGMLFKDKANTFAPYRVGKYGGFYWTSMATDAVTANKSYGFSFDYANCTPVYNNSRAVGLGIRCMKE